MAAFSSRAPACSRRSLIAIALTVFCVAHLRRGARPAGAALRPLARVLRRRAWSSSPISQLGFVTALDPVNILYCFVGVLLGTMVGVPARHRADRDDRHAAADHLQVRAGHVADHARRHLLRRAVRRLDDGDPDQPAGRILLRRDRHRRLPDGAAGQGRPGARHRGARLVLRRHGGDASCWCSSRRRSPASR